MLQRKLGHAAAIVFALVGVLLLQAPGLASQPPVITTPTGDPAVLQDPTVPPEDAQAPSDTHPTTRLLVRTEDAPTEAETAEVLEELDAVEHTELSEEWMAVETETPVTAAEAEQVTQDEGVVDVEEDVQIWGPSAYPNDPYFPNQWGFHGGYGSKADVAWNTVIGGSVTVAVVDTGVDIGHPDLNANAWLNVDEAVNGYDDDRNGYVDDVYGWDFSNDDNSVYDGTFDSHGTHVAGTIGARTNNGTGVAGMNWQVKIMPVKFIGSNGSGYTSDAVRAINYAVANGAKVINCSWGGGSYSASLRSAIQAAANAGVLVVVAAGNSATNLDVNTYYPVGYALSNMIGVAALASDGSRASFSNYGPGRVHIAAPGQTILSTLPGGYGYYSGTSMATPHVAGAAALVWAMSPGASMSTVRSAVLNSAAYTPGVAGLVQTSGRLDVASALGMLGFRAYGGFRGGVFVAAGDVTGDSSDEILVGADAGGGPHVQVLDETGVARMSFFAYGAEFRGGVRVAAGDVDGDGKKEIITATGPGASPHVRVIRANGTEYCGMYAYAPTFGGGVYVAAADVDGDGKDEVITGAGATGGPHVIVFDGCTAKNGFYAYAPSFQGGVRVGAGDVAGDGRAEIVLGAGPGGSPHVRVVDRNGSQLGSFYAYSTNFLGGVYVAAGQGDGFVVTGAGEGGGPHVRTVSPSGAARADFFMTDTGGVNGVRVSVGSFDAGDPALALTGGPSSASFVGLRSESGAQASSLFS